MGAAVIAIPLAAMLLPIVVLVVAVVIDVVAVLWMLIGWWRYERRMRSRQPSTAGLAWAHSAFAGRVPHTG